MTADAVVVAARADGYVDLEFSPSRQCAACAGTCLWKRLQSARLERLAVGNLVPGTEVTVALSERSVLRASILLHGLPLAAILIGAAAGAAASGSDFGTMIGAVCGLTIAIAGFKGLSRRLEQATLADLVVTPKS
jgi:positive regulator of sigma E activity